ncbi:MAG TPA: hypothetical protein VIM57_09015 [Luteolibacter sp.]
MIFETANSTGSKWLNAFAAEEQPTLAALKKGSVKLATIPGFWLRPDFPTGKVDPARLDFLMLGETRTWENTNGKRIEAKLISLTDEDVSLLIGDNVARVPLKNLGSTDLAYLERLKRGKEPCYRDKVDISNYGWENNPSHRVRLSGEQCARLAKQGSGFEKALAAAIQYAGSKLDADQWELRSFSESLVPRPAGERATRSAPATTEDQLYYYVAEFDLKKKGELKARTQWPLNVSPKSWRGAPTLRIYATANGDILEPEPSN